MTEDVYSLLKAAQTTESGRAVITEAGIEPTAKQVVQFFESRGVKCQAGKVEAILESGLSKVEPKGQRAYHVIFSAALNDLSTELVNLYKQEKESPATAAPKKAAASKKAVAKKK